MNYSCEICDETIKLISKKNHPKSFTDIKFEKCIRINHTNEKYDFFDVD